MSADGGRETVALWRTILSNETHDEQETFMVRRAIGAKRNQRQAERILFFLAASKFSSGDS